MTENSEREPNENVYRIPLEYLPYLQDRIEALNDRAKRIGVDGVELIEIGREKVARKNNKAIIDIFVMVQVEGRPVKLEGGWYFVGTIEHTEVGNILRDSPFLNPPFTLAGIPNKYRGVGPDCEHCGLERKRNDTYIVAKPDGSTVQVGKTCLKDYVGHRDPNDIASYVESLAEIRNYAEALEDPDFIEGGGGRQVLRIKIVAYLAYVAAVIRLWGWVSRSKADYLETPTADEALNWLTSPKNRGGRLVDNFGVTRTTRDGRDIEVTEEDDQLARATYEWVLALPEDRYTGNEYLHNLVIAFTAARESDGVMNLRHDGLVASAVFVYKRELAQVEEAKAKAESEGWEPGHVGEVGQRQDFEGLRLVRIYEHENQWGTNWYHTFIDPTGKTISWKKTTYPPLVEGQTYSGKATVKAHDEYKGTPQTVITRANFILQCCDNPKPGKNTNPDWDPGLNPVVCQNCGAAH